MEGVRTFYDADKVKRDGAMPGFIRLPLFGQGAVHGLDGRAHEVRKNALADLAYEHVARFAVLVSDELEGMLGDWARSSPGTVYDDTSTAFGRVATNPVAQLERLRLDRWATGLVRAVRSGRLRADPDSVLAAMADLRDQRCTRRGPYRRRGAAEPHPPHRGGGAIRRVRRGRAHGEPRVVRADPGRLGDRRTALRHPGSRGIRPGRGRRAHRPGEKIAVTALSAAVAALCRPEVRIIADDLTFPWTQMLTRPATGVRVTWRDSGTAAR